MGGGGMGKVWMVKRMGVPFGDGLREGEGGGMISSNQDKRRRGIEPSFMKAIKQHRAQTIPHLHCWLSVAMVASLLEGITSIVTQDHSQFFQLHTSQKPPR